ncbi:hypothetical protein [Labilibaculum euxinus]
MTIKTSGQLSLSEIASELGCPASSTLAFMVSIATNSKSPVQVNKTAPHKISEFYGYRHTSSTPAKLKSIYFNQLRFDSVAQYFDIGFRTDTAPYGRVVKIHLHINPTGVSSGTTLYDGIIYSGVAPTSNTTWLTGKIDLNLDYLWPGKLARDNFNVMCYYTAYFEDTPSINVYAERQWILRPQVTTTTS